MAIKKYIAIENNEDSYIIFPKKKNDFDSVELNYYSYYILRNINETINTIVEKIRREFSVYNKSDIVIRREIYEVIEFFKYIRLVKMDYNFDNEKSSDYQIYSYYDVIKELQENYFNDNKIYKVFLEITYDCNLFCKHCYRSEYINHNINKNILISFDNIKHIIDCYIENNVVELILTGGEIFKHPDIYKILDYIQDKEILLTILTNGTVLSDNDLDKLSKYDIYDIRFSIYGNEKIHDKFTGVIGSYRKTLHSIDKLSNILNNVSINFVVTKYAANIAKEVIDKFKDMNISINIVPSITPTSKGNRNTRNNSLTLKQYKTLIMNNNIPLHGSNCTAGVSRLRIDPFGNVLACEMLNCIFGNIYNDNFNKILEGEIRNTFINKFKKVINDHSCNYCNKRQICNFCPGIFIIDNNDINIPSKYICSRSQVKYELYGDKF